MIYHHFRYFFYISAIFGLKYPFAEHLATPRSIKLCCRIWSLVLVTILFVFYNLWLKIQADKVEMSLSKIQIYLDLIVNILIILIGVIKGEESTVKVNEMVSSIFQNFGCAEGATKMIVSRIMWWFSIPLAVYLSSIISEIVSEDPPYAFIARIPTFITILHLLFHLILFLFISRKINQEISSIMKEQRLNNYFIQNNSIGKSKFSYFFSFNIKPLKLIERNAVELKLLCTFYDDLCIGMRLLEKSHGSQVLLSICSMFTNAVTAVTLFSLYENKFPLLVALRGLLPFFWGFLLSFIGTRLRKEVQTMDMLIMKYLIDFRCDEPRRHVLQIFKQLIASSSLSFACSQLFDLSYGMLLAAAVNVITYSIILVQLLMAK